VSLDPSVAATLGAVHIVGTGLLGTSVGLGLAGTSVRVTLADPSPTALALARDLGAGLIEGGGADAAGAGGADENVSGGDRGFVSGGDRGVSGGDRGPALIVVAAPPDVTADVVAGQLGRFPTATVTDVASVKAGVLRELVHRGVDLSRYVGGHPMAGRERSGAVAARGDLFLGRPWVVCPTAKTEPERVDAVCRLALALGAVPITMAPEEHDAAVARVSHVPQIAASLVAARLRPAPDAAVALAGQGLRDVTRIAGSDPMLWAQILAANAGPVVEVLRELRADLDTVIAAMDALAREAPGEPAASGRAAVARVVAEGRLGRERIPGKHGGSPTRYAILTVLVPDVPGSLARLFADVGAAGVNIEELVLEHSPGRAVGLVEVSVLPGSRGTLEKALTAAGWQVVA
jgi:prephenate dehydrogenase